MKSSSKYAKVLMPIFILVIILLIIQVWLRSNTFDESILNEDNIYNHIEELTSEKYFGRLAGSDGNEMALDYITSFFQQNGIEPAGDNESYYQNFSTIMPQIDANPIFNISLDGEIVREFKLYEDYKILTSNNGGSIDFSGELLILGNNLKRVDPSLIKDRIVVIASDNLTYELVSYVMQNEGSGIFAAYRNFSYRRASEFLTEKSLGIYGKTGASIMAGYLSPEAYRDLSGIIEDNNIEEGEYYSGIIPNVKVKSDISFPIVTTANVIAKIEGKSKNGRVLIISANMDGSGESTNGEYFIGATSTASAVATLLETARVIKAQTNLPYETIVFIAFNAQESQLAGSNYYLNNPLFPLDKTTIIHLDNLGEASREGTKLYSDDIDSSILKSKLKSYAEDATLMVQSDGMIYDALVGFRDKKIQTVTLSDARFILNNSEDTIDAVDKSTLKNSALVLLNYLKRDIYNDLKADYLTLLDKLLLFIFIFGLMFNYTLIKLNKTNPNSKLGKTTIENLYFNSATTAIRKFYYSIAPLILSIFLLAFLANISPEANIQTINNETVTNFSFYLTVKNSIYYLKSLFSFSGNSLAATKNLFSVISSSSVQTIKLMSASLILSIILGISRGIYEGYKSKNSNLRSISTLIVFSIPDVLIVLFGMLIYVYVSRNFPNVKDVIKLDEFILPLITLSILPTIYISRITFLTIEEEIKKDYIMNAKAKGFSKIKIFLFELFPAIAFKITDTLPAIMTMILSNMIVVEYLFNYNGVVYYLLYFFKSQDINGFIALSLTLGSIFIAFTWGIKSIAKQINPLKKEEKNAKK